MAYTAIDIGAGATNWGGEEYGGYNYTEIDINNPANANGILTSMESYIQLAQTNFIIGTMYGSGASWTSRDYESIGNTTTGSKQTWTGKNCDVQTNDCIAYYCSSGEIEAVVSGSGRKYKLTNYFNGTTNTYTEQSDFSLSLYATGITVPDAPTSVAATENNSTKVTITWTAGTGETDGHRVYRDGSDISGVVAHDTATYDDTTGTAGVTYSYTVYAINPAGLSAASTADNGLKTGVPVLTTSPISSLSVSGFTANGEITNTGGVNATVRGFCYMIGSSGDPNIGSNAEVHDDGNYSAGTYSKAITGLDIAANNYRVRAYAVNTVGTGYGQTITVSKTIKTRFTNAINAGTGKLVTADDNSLNTNTFARMQVLLNKSVNAGSLTSGEIVSTYSLVYTGGQSNYGAHIGAILAPNGDIHFIPHYAIKGQKISSAGVVSTYSLVYTSGNYTGGVLASNGDIHFVPSVAPVGQKISSNGTVSTYSLVYTISAAYEGGVLAPNGDIHFVPYSAARGQKISSSGVVSTYSLVNTVGQFWGGVLAPNGDIHFVPQSTTCGQKISSSGVVSTYSLVYTAGSYIGGVLAPNGDIHFVPYSADRGQKISSAGVVSTYSLVYTVSAGYIGGVLAPNGDIHFVPSYANKGQKIDKNGVVSTYSLVYTNGSQAYYGGVLAPNGDIHFVPMLATVGQKISTNPAIPFSQAVCMSPFFNKF